MRNENTRNFRELSSELAERARERERDLQADQIFEAGGMKRLILRSSDGHYWQVNVSNAGVLTTTDLGVSLP